MAPALTEDHLFCLSLINPPTSTGNFPFPGASSESTKKLVEKLKENYIHNHAMFGGNLFHNHVMDHLLGLWSVGGTAEALNEVYITHDYEEPVKESPEPITDDNFVKHLGDSTFYSAYVTYFCKALAKASPTEVLERFLFTPANNVAPNLPRDVARLQDGEQHPEMLNRVMSILLHPMIHIGYGVEFGIVQQIADGLAHTAIHQRDQRTSAPFYLFETEDLYKRGLSKLSLPAASTGSPPFLSLHHAIATDPRFTPSALQLPRPDIASDPITGGLDFFKFFSTHGTAVTELVNQWYDRWTVGVPEDGLEDRLEKMVEDVILGNVYYYGLAGFIGRGQTAFNADFLTMHFVTSSIFLPSLCLPPGRTRAQTLNPPLSLASRLLFVRIYAATCGVWYIARLRPSAKNMSFADFYATTTPKLAQVAAPHAYAPGQAPKRDFHHNTQVTMPVSMTVWPRIFQSAAAHPNEHVIKIIRALAAFDLWYGQRPAGAYAGAHPGAEVCDGTIFLRTAILTMDRMGWAYEQKELEQWDRSGYHAGTEKEERGW